MYKGSIFSSPNTSGVRCSLVIYLSEWKPHIQRHSSYKNCIEVLLEAFRKQDGLQKHSMHRNPLLSLQWRRLFNRHQQNPSKMCYNKLSKPENTATPKNLIFQMWLYHNRKSILKLWLQYFIRRDTPFEKKLVYFRRK